MRDCEHGSLARSCEICELKQEIVRLKATVQEKLDLLHAQKIRCVDLIHYREKERDTLATLVREAPTPCIGTVKKPCRPGTRCAVCSWAERAAPWRKP